MHLAPTLQHPEAAPANLRRQEGQQSKDTPARARVIKMARIAVDMDEVMADTVAEHIRRYNEDFRTEISPEDMEGKWLWQCVPKQHLAALQGYLDEPQFFRHLPVMPGAQRVLERLSRDHEIFIASAAMEVPSSFAAKFEWIQEHFPFIRPSHTVFCGDKGILAADYLIDDNPRQLRSFRGTGLLFSSPHNRHVKDWIRVEDWDAVEQYFYS